MSPSANDQPSHLQEEDSMVACPSNIKSLQDDEAEQQAQRTRTIHQLLARQLEYYFSTSNLDKDTYVSTLRSLNDGYVPVSILANFGKVQALAPFESAFEAVQTAATEFSELLEVVHVDSNTGKRVKKEDAPSTTVVAVGPVSGEPIPMDQISSTLGGSSSTSSTTIASNAIVVTPAAVKNVSTSFFGTPGRSNGVQNTIIIRETPDDIQEDNIRDLFAFDACPPIESVYLDLQNCWFVTLDTASRDAMVDVMFRLRTQKFPSGEPIKARLKSSAISSVSPTPLTIIPVHQYDPQEVVSLYAPPLLSNNQDSNNGGHLNGNKKKHSSKGRRNKGKNQQQPSSSNHNKTNGPNLQGQQPKRAGIREDPSGRSSSSSWNRKAEKKQPEPPKLGEDEFPSLPPSEEDSTNKVEVEKVPDQRSDVDEDEFDKNRHMGAGFSDSSSTATTSTSSTPSPSHPNITTVVGGYAAALLRPAAPVPVVRKNTASGGNNQEKKGKNANGTGSVGKVIGLGKEPTKASKIMLEGNANPPMKVQPPSWGRGRSFADVLRKEHDAAASASAQ